MKRLTSYIQLVVVAILMVACSTSELTPEIVESESRNGCFILRLTIDGVAFSTRATGIPSGGENGDGLRPGLHHENDINNISLFYFNAGPLGINGSNSTPVHKLAFVENIDFHPTEGQMNVTRDVDITGINYTYTPDDQFIVVANAGSIGATTLGELRNHLIAVPWTSSPDGLKANYTNFAMTSANPSHYHGGKGTKEDPRIIMVDVERTAARIDFCTDGSTISGQTLKYSVFDGKPEQKVGEMYLSHIRPFNLMSEPTYLAKRLSEGQDATKNYLADETTPTTLYVEEPHTWMKNNPSEALLNSWFGASRYGVMTDSWFNSRPVHVSPTGNGYTNGTSVDIIDGDTYYVLDYTNENTMTPECTTSSTVTGIAMKGVYKPLNVFNALDADGMPVVDESYAYGQTFWRCRPVTTVYDETQALYFSSETVCQQYVDAHPTQIYEVLKYDNAICYYVVFLRHDNSPDSPYITPMEFGIVRNNIYRLRVDFTGPGYNEIPDETVDPEGVKPYIYVRKWYYIEHPVIEV